MLIWFTSVYMLEGSCKITVTGKKSFFSHTELSLWRGKWPALVNFSFPFLFFSFFTAFDRSYKTQFENKLLAKILYTRFIHLSPFWVQKETCLCTTLESSSHTAPPSLLPRHVGSVCALGSAFPGGVSVASVYVWISDHLASEPFIILSFLQEEMNILQRGWN